MSVAVNSEKQSAKDEITKSVRDLLNVTITLPLGNPNLKLVHTNQFIFTELPTDFFELANMSAIAKALNSTDSRYSGYQVNRWYIEKVKIRKKVTGEGSMELSVNPFASSLRQYRDNKHSMEKTYTDTMNKTNTTANKTNNKKVKSVTKVNNVAGGQGKYIDNLVKKVVGNTTDDLKKAKKIHSHLQSYLTYRGYRDSLYHSAEKAYKAKRINCADTSILTRAMFLSAGLDAYITHLGCHYFTIVRANGKLHCSDATSNYRNFDVYLYYPNCGGAGSSNKNFNHKHIGSKTDPKNM